MYSLHDDILIKAEVIKFNAPVAELKPFYYYELTFPPTADSFAMYTEEKDFSLVLGKIIRDYGLIFKNELNKANVSRFIKDYYGGPALLAKIKSVEDYLNETRYFNEQVKRDRTKPVTIINDRVIMQDGVKIGLIAEFSNSVITRVPVEDIQPVFDSSRAGVIQRVRYNELVNTIPETQILLSNGRKTDNRWYYYTYNSGYQKNKQAGTGTMPSLYQVSKAANKNLSSRNDQMLMRICFMIENYAL